MSIDSLDLSSSDRAILKAFVAAWFEHGRPVLFAGAGLSKNAERRPTAPKDIDFASWSELTKQLAADLTGGDEDLKHRLPTNDLRLAELHQAQLHRSVLLDRVAKAVPTEHFTPGRVHELLTRLPWAAVVTTNYDDLLERAFARRSVRKVIWDADLTRRRTTDDLLIIKMHGDLADGASIVLTEEDYRRYSTTRPGVEVKVKQLLLEHPLLFIGFSLMDPNYANIDGWIRDTVSAVKLPAVALMRAPVLPAERVMWQRRGVHLLSMTNDLSDVVHALETESLRLNRRPNAAAQRGDPSSLVRKLLEQKPSNWHREVGQALGTTDESGSSERYALDGRILGISSKDVQAIIDSMPAAQRQSVLLRAHESGMITIRGNDMIILDIADTLLSDRGLGNQQRASVLLRRARQARQRRDLASARKDLRAAEPIALSNEAKETIDLEDRELVWLSENAEEIRKRLVAPPVEGNALCYCRRGSDALALLDTETAEKLYQFALTATTNGDEETAALMGLTACSDWRKEAARTIELDEKRMAIRPEDRPRTESLWRRRGKAGEALLNEKREVAARELEDAIAEAQRLGWPRSTHISDRTALDILVDDYIKLQICEDATVENIKSALLAAVRNGRPPTRRLITESVIARLASTSDDVAWIRELIRYRSESPPLTHRSRELLCSAFLPFLEDAPLAQHVREVLLDRVIEAQPNTRGDIVGAHAELLRQHFWCFPNDLVADMVLACLPPADGAWNQSAVDIGGAPLKLWARRGALGRADTDRVFAAVVTGIAAPELIDNWLLRHSLLRALAELQGADVLSPEQQGAAIGALEQFLRKAERSTDDRISGVLDAIAALSQFPDWAPDAAVAETTVKLYPSIRNSTLAGEWAACLRRVAPMCEPVQAAALSGQVREYVALASKPDPNSIVHHPFWAAQMVAALAAAQPATMPINESMEILRSLVTIDSSAALCFAELRGLINPTELKEAEALVLRSLTRASASRGDLLDAWIESSLDGGDISRAIQERLLANLYDSDAWCRMRAYHQLRRVMSRRQIAPELLPRFRAAATEYGVVDEQPYVRASAARALGDGSAAGDATKMTLTGLLSDPFAAVRRSAELALIRLEARFPAGSPPLGIPVAAADSTH